MPQKQDFVAPATDPMKPAKIKGSSRASESRFEPPPRKLVIMTKKREPRAQIYNKMNDISLRCIYNEFVRSNCDPLCLGHAQALVHINC